MTGDAGAAWPGAEAYATLMERWSDAMRDAAGSAGGADAFAAASGQMLALYAQQVQALRAASRSTAETLGIATTEDLAATSTLVINVERKVDELTDGIAAIAARLDRIEAALRAAAATPAPPAPAPAPAEAPAAKRPARRRTTKPSEG